MSLLDTLKPIECSCKKCRSMCHITCFGTPKDIQKLIDNGYGDRLCLDVHCGTNPDAHILLLKPALKGYEGKAAPYVPRSEAGCTFWHYGKCKLHSSGLKPTGGKLAIHDGPFEHKLSCEVSQTWDSDEGQALVKWWCDKYNVPMKEHIPTKEEMAELVRVGRLAGID